MKEKFREVLKAAMKSRDQVRIATVRLVLAAIQERENASPTGKVSDEEVMQVLARMIRQRKESVEAFDKAGRTELAAAEREEIKLIEEFLPKQMSEDETFATIGALIQELGATGPKDMGRVMAALKERFPGRVDMGKASAMVKEKLAP